VISPAKQKYDKQQNVLKSVIWNPIIWRFIVCHSVGSFSAMIKPEKEYWNVDKQQIVL
jgi:hypothetical protein